MPESASTAAGIDLEGLGLDFDPFAAAHSDRVPLFSGGERGRQLEQLTHFTQWARSVIIVTGELGSGKSRLCAALAERIPEGTRLALLTGGILTSARELLLRIGHGFGLSLDEALDVDGLTETLVDQIGMQREIDGHGAVILLDDAHELDREAVLALARLALLALEARSINVVLFAEPEFVGALRRTVQGLEPPLVWHEIRISPLTPADTRAYLEHHLQAAGLEGEVLLSPALIDSIQRRSHGVPAQINRLAAQALARASHGRGAMRLRLPRAHLVAIAVLTGLLGGLALFYGSAWMPASDSPPATADSTSQPPAGPEELLLSEPDFGDTGAAPVEALPHEPAVALDGSADVAVADANRSDAITSDETGPDALPAPEEVAGSAPAPAPVVAAPAALEDPGVAWVRAQPPEAWTVQVAGLSTRAAMERFLAAQPAGEPFVGFATRRGSADWFVLVYGSFESRAEASAAAARLPPSVGRVRPWIRRFADLQAAL